MFRTLGKLVPKAVKDADVRCLANDRKTIRSGAKNCWAYWLEGGGIGNPKVDQYLWLTTEGVEC